MHSLNIFIEHLLCIPGMDPNAGDPADNKTDPNSNPHRAPSLMEARQEYQPMEKMAVSQRPTPLTSKNMNTLLLKSEGNNELPKGSC